MKVGSRVLAFDSRCVLAGQTGWDALRDGYREAETIRVYSDSDGMTLVDVRFTDGQVSRGHERTAVKKIRKDV